jgi:hypothetical protein
LLRHSARQLQHRFLIINRELRDNVSASMHEALVSERDEDRQL